MRSPFSIQELVVCKNVGDAFKTWVKNYGEYKYQDIADYLTLKCVQVNEDTLAYAARYEYNLSNLIFEVLGHVENYIRADICRDFFLIRSDNKTYFVGLNKKQFAVKSQNDVNDVYEYTNQCLFSYIQSLYTRLYKTQMKANFCAINTLRNAVCHRKVLFTAKYDSCTTSLGDDSSLCNNIVNMLSYLPEEELQNKYVDLINALSEKYTEKCIDPIFLILDRSNVVRALKGRL